MLEQRLQAVVSPSWRLRDALVAQVLGAWTGPVKRVAEPDDMEAIVLGLDSASLFEEPACWVVRGDERYWSRHAHLLVPLVDEPAVAGVLVLVAAKLPRNETLGRRLAAAGAYLEAEVPEARELPDWLAAQLARTGSVEEPRAVAQVLMRCRGEDVDALLEACEQARLHAGDEPLRAEHVEAALGGAAERPVWAFNDAVLGGRGAEAIELLHAGRGIDPHHAATALAGELRKGLACLASADDRETARLAGVRASPRQLHHARRRARDLGRRTLVRLLSGVLQLQRDLRRGGVDGRACVERFVLQSGRVIRQPARPGKRAGHSRGGN